MLSYFGRKKRGAITIMLTILLLVVLSLNSTFLETSRYISMERLYKEMEENAAFSLLSKYDRDLFENYGLLAMDPSVGEEELKKYLNANLNTALENANGIDMALTFSGEDINIVKLYNLSEFNVFKTQINEFCAYRAPINLMNNMLGFEETIEELIEKLEESLPILNLFNKLTAVSEKIVEYHIKTAEYLDKTITLYMMREEYTGALEAYNDAVESRDDWRDMDKEEMTSEELSSYQETLEAKNEAVESAASALAGSISPLTAALTEQYTAYEEMMEAQEEMLGAGIETALADAAVEADGISDEKQKKNAKEMIEKIEESYSESESWIDQIAEADEWIKETIYNQTKLSLEAQAESLTGDGASLGKASEVIVISQGFWSVYGKTYLNLWKTFEGLAEDWQKTLSVLKEATAALEIFATKGIFNPTLNHSVNGDLAASLPGAGGKMGAVINEHAASDELKKNAKIAETEAVADAVHFNTNLLADSDADVEAAMLEECMENVRNSWDTLSTQIRSLNDATGILEVLNKIFSICGALADFIVDLIALIGAFTENIVKDILTTFLFQKLYPATYAKEMFSNRVSEDDDERMNGSSFRELDNGKGFKQANTEYILIGSNNEILNQSGTFGLMLMFRLLCNIPAILSDSVLHEVVSSLCAVPLVGAIIAVLLVVCIIVCEAYADMIFIIYGEDGVDCIKVTGYFNLSGEGLDDLVEQTESLFENTLEVLEEDDDKKDKDGKAKADNDDPEFANWDYKDHMFILLLLFVSGDKMYARTANLIEMDLREEKGDEYKLSEMATYLRVESEAEYSPLLPIPEIPGLNNSKLKITNLHYSGY